MFHEKMIKEGVVTGALGLPKSASTGCLQSSAPAHWPPRQAHDSEVTCVPITTLC